MRRPNAAHYLINHKASGLKEGDRVKIVRIAEDCQGGWENDWTFEMTNSVGDILTIIRDESTSGFLLKNRYSYPHFVLEKVVE